MDGRCGVRGRWSIQNHVRVSTWLSSLCWGVSLIYPPLHLMTAPFDPVLALLSVRGCSRFVGRLAQKGGFMPSLKV